MGISTEARLIYGAYYKELSESVDNLSDLIDDDELAYASPYYDADRSQWFVGIDLASKFMDSHEMIREMELAREQFHALVGDDVEAYFHVVPHVS